MAFCHVKNKYKVSVKHISKEQTYFFEIDIN